MKNELFLNYLIFLLLVLSVSNLIAVTFLPVIMLLVLSVRKPRAFSILPISMLLLLLFRTLRNSLSSANLYAFIITN